MGVGVDQAGDEGPAAAIHHFTGRIRSLDLLRFPHGHNRITSNGNGPLCKNIVALIHRDDGAAYEKYIYLFRHTPSSNVPGTRRSGSNEEGYPAVIFADYT